MIEYNPNVAQVQPKQGNNAVNDIGSDEYKEPALMLGTKVACLLIKQAQSAKDKANDYMQKIKDANAAAKACSDEIEKARTARAGINDKTKITQVDDAFIKYCRDKGIKIPPVHTEDEIGANNKLASNSYETKYRVKKSELMAELIVSGNNSLTKEYKIDGKKVTITVTLQDINAEIGTYGNRGPLLDYVKEGKKITHIRYQDPPKSDSWHSVSLPLSDNSTDLEKAAVKEYLKDYASYINKNGQMGYDKNYADNQWNSAEWDAVIKSLEDYRDNLLADNQTHMVHVQDYMAQYNSYTQAAMKTCTDMHSTLSSMLTR